MRRYYITNAFFINLLPERKRTHVVFHPLSIEEARMEMEGCEVIAINNDTAAIMSAWLGYEIPVNRSAAITLSSDRSYGLLIVQYSGPPLPIPSTVCQFSYILHFNSGPRLPKRMTTFPEDAKIEFWAVNLASQ